MNKHVPAINTPVVTDEQLINTISQLDAAVTDILEAGRKNEETYQNKAELARRARQLETSIQLTESEAICTIIGTGKDAYGLVMMEGKEVKVACTNDTSATLSVDILAPQIVRNWQAWKQILRLSRFPSSRPGKTWTRRKKP